MTYILFAAKELLIDFRMKKMNENKTELEDNHQWEHDRLQLNTERSLMLPFCLYSEIKISEKSPLKFAAI